jgi:hypothetical protein
MNYEKLTVDLFVQKCKEGKYAGLTGARRAIGKTDWSEKDRKTAHAFADKFFEGKAAAPARSPKPAKAKAERAPRTVKQAKKSAKAPAAAAKRTPAAAAEPRVARAPVVPVPSLPRMMQGDDPSTVRAHSAALIISALRNSGPLNEREQYTYDIAISEYSANARETARRVVEAASGGLPFPKAGDSLGSTPTDDTPTSVSVPAGTAPRVSPPNNGETDTSNMSPELKAQHERLLRAREASTATNTPPARTAD